jgi:hypothetical protein
MACLLPFRPWLSPDLRVFSSGTPRRVRILVVGWLLSCTSTPPQRLASCVSPTYPRLMPTMSRSRRTPRYVPSAPQHMRIEEPLFSPPFEGVPPALPYQREVPLLGFGYPFSGLGSPALGSLFQPPTLTGFTLQSFSPAWRSRTGFPVPFRSRAFPQDPSASCRRPSGFLPPSQPYPSLLPKLLARVGARLLSWAF